jgi:hypothetical protein
MKMKANGWLLAALAIVVVALSAPAQASVEYDAGFTWRRYADWTVSAEGNEGTTEGNPAEDAYGNPVWNYESVQGEGLEGEFPWYAEDGEDMVWNFAGARWQKDGEAKPNINYVGMTQSTQEQTCLDIPVVRWENPTGNTILMSITGGMRVEWNGSANMPVDMVIAQLSENGAESLYETTVSKPDEKGNLVWSIPAVLTRVDAGDSIVISARATECVPGASWVTFKDYGVTMKIAAMLPEPGSLTVLALGAVALVRRKK